MAKRVAIIDGNSLMHRAFHAVPDYMTAPDGRPTNAVFGFISMLLKLVEGLTPDGVIAAFDRGIPEFRLEAIEQYKATRTPTDENLVKQFPMIKEVLEALEIPVVELQGWEGDDILGTLAAQAKQAGAECLLVTSDKDALQLVDENTKVVNSRSGANELVVFDREAVIERWGVPPELICDFLGLMGDSSDNIPGVPGVGEKRAQALLLEYGTMDDVLANADGIKGKMGESLRQNADLARASRRAATISCDVPVQCDIQSVRFPGYQAARATEVFRKFGLTSQLTKVLKLAESAQGVSDADAGSAGAGVGGAGSGAGGAGLGDAGATKGDVGSSGSGAGDASGRTSDFSSSGVDGTDASDTSGSCGETITPHERVTHYSYQDGQQAIDTLLLALDQKKTIALVILEAQAQGNLFESNEPSLYAAVEGQALNLGTLENKDLLVKLYTQATQLVAFDHKATLGYLLPKDMSQSAAIHYNDIDASRLFDCGLAAYLIDSTAVPNSLEQLLARYPQLTRDSYTLEAAPFAVTSPAATADTASPAATAGPEGTASSAGAAGTTAATPAPTPISESEFEARLDVIYRLAGLLELATIMHQQMQEQNALPCYESIEKPLIAVLAQMERTGVRIEPGILAEMNQTVTAELQNLVSQAHQLADEEFNLDSPKQVGAVLFDKLKLPPIKKTRTGYSTDASVLEELKTMHPLPAIMLEYRELAKLKSTYLDALPRLIASDGKIHTTLHQNVTATGRLSSADPNLQNIPVRTELGRQIRLAFVPDAAALGVDHAVLLGADYSQIELRVLAHCSEDPGMVQSFIAGEDFHTMTAAQVWSIVPDQVTSELRTRAKAVNFGIVYGQQSYGLSQSLGISFQEAQTLIDRYFTTFPGVRDYLDKTVALARSQGWVETIFGRRRYLKDIYSSNANTRNFANRTAMNHPMQGSAADIIKLAMIDVMNRIMAEGYRAQLILQVHDELLLNCAADDVEAISAMVRNSMESVCELKVPLLVDINIGANWAEAH